MKHFNSLVGIVFTLVFLAPSILLSQPEIPNWDFENWEPKNGYEYPVNWNMSSGWGGGVENAWKSSDAYTGSFAVHLKNLPNPGKTIRAWAWLNGSPYSRGLGIPFQNKPKYFSFYYKYQPGGNKDHCVVQASLTRWDTVKRDKILIGVSLNGCYPKSTYTYNRSEMYYFSEYMHLNPDSLYISILASANEDDAELNSEIYVDHLKFEGEWPTDAPYAKEQNSKPWLTKTNTERVFRFTPPGYLIQKNSQGSIQVYFYNTQGRSVHIKKINSIGEEFEIPSRLNGLFIYLVKVDEFTEYADQIFLH